VILSDSANISRDKRAVLVVGGINIDIYGRADIAESNQENPADSNPGIINTYAGGVARNIAENLGRLGLGVAFIGCFGTDDFTDFLKTSLTDADVDISLSTNSKSCNDSYLSLFRGDGSLISAVNQMQNVAEISPRYLEQRQQEIEKVPTLVLEGNLSEATIACLVRMKGRNQKLAADMVSATKALRFKNHLSEIDILKCNQLEAAALSGLPERSALPELSAALIDEGVGCLLLSAAGQGFMLADAEETVWIEATKTPPSGTTSGAGDALLAGYIYGIETGLDKRQAASFARDLAALTLQCDGATHPNLKELLK
jgi:pseudouridine kinase